MDYDILINQIVLTLRSVEPTREMLSQSLAEICEASWHLASEIANAETTENTAIVQAKEDGFKVSFAEAETRGKMNTSGQKTKLKLQYEVMGKLFEAIQEKIKLTYGSLRPQPSLPIHHQVIPLSSSSTNEGPSA